MMLTHHEIQSADTRFKLRIDGDWKDYHQQMTISVDDGSGWPSAEVTLTLQQVIDLRKRLNKWFATGSLEFDGEK